MKSQSTVVVIGNFDGVHRGHQAVLADAAFRARGQSAHDVNQAVERELVVLTFDPHPSAVVGRGEPARLTTMQRRVELLERHGASRVVVQKFDRTFAAQSPEAFARELLTNELHANEVVVGANFRFGAKRAGDFSTLVELGKSLGFVARAHAVAEDDRGPFSSTRARKAIESGDLEETLAVLGRFHSISGVVGRGQQLGRTLGFPTANLHDIPELGPPDGIYAVLVDELDQDGRAKALAKGVMSIGVRPTIEGASGRTSEVFLFDFSRDLYGARLRVHFVARQRPELKFDGLEPLVAQMKKDDAEARTILAKYAPNGEIGGAWA
ncbi:MAG TPA: bifunctional riboflavin kinase/FAD synthetase [Polyangiaceae bacterium]